MFTPKLSAAQCRAATDLRTRLAGALEPVVVGQPAELSSLIAKRNEIAAAIAGIERRTAADNLEEQAQILANRKAQLHLVEVRLKELRDAHEAAEALAKNKSAETLAAISDEAWSFLADVAGDFHGQHRAAFKDAAVQYATRPAQADQLVNLFPFFHDYLRAIRRFRENGADPARLLQFLGDALEGQDYLMAPSS
jgi:antitoxin (DNA-binding transcriptional repressor) of toxin-antitoxin stability system